MKYTITENKQYKGIEVYFDGKPSEDIRAALKAMRFRWHSVKKCWYGSEGCAEAVRRLLSGEGEAPKAEAPKAAKVSKAAKPEPQSRIRIYWNGIKVDGGELIRCGYSLGDGSVTIYERGYKDLPRDLLPVVNESDSMTDYFENDRATLRADHPLYKYFRFAAMKARARMDSKYCDSLRADLGSGKREPWPGHYNALRQDLTRREAFLREFSTEEDPGQPTAEDLAAIDRRRQEAENRRRQEEHEREIAEREKVLAETVEGREYISRVSAEHPIEDGAPVVRIPFSENPAFYSFMREDRKRITLNPDGTKTEEIIEAAPRCVLSVAAADIVLRHFDEIRKAEGRGYDKTDFIITGTDPETGEPFTYEGRYDLGDGDGGMISHIRALGEWDLTHDLYGHEKTEPEETNSRIQFADFLQTFIDGAASAA